MGNVVTVGKFGEGVGCEGFFLQLKKIIIAKNKSPVLMGLVKLMIKIKKNYYYYKPDEACSYS